MGPEPPEPWTGAGKGLAQASPAPGPPQICTSPQARGSQGAGNWGHRGVTSRQSCRMSSTETRFHQSRQPVRPLHPPRALLWRTGQDKVGGKGGRG